MSDDGLFTELWKGFRPYLVKLSEDFLVSVTLWAALFGFEQLTHVLPIDGWPGQFISYLHAAGMVCSVGLFSFLSVADIWAIRKASAQILLEAPGTGPGALPPPSEVE